MSTLRETANAVRSRHPANCQCNDCLRFDADESAYARRFYDPRERTLDEIESDMFSKPAFGPL